MLLINNILESWSIVRWQCFYHRELEITYTLNKRTICVHAIEVSSSTGYLILITFRI